MVSSTITKCFLLPLCLWNAAALQMMMSAFLTAAEMLGLSSDSNRCLVQPRSSRYGKTRLNAASSLQQQRSGLPVVVGVVVHKVAYMSLASLLPLWSTRVCSHASLRTKPCFKMQLRDEKPGHTLLTEFKHRLSFSGTKFSPQCRERITSRCSCRWPSQSRKCRTARWLQEGENANEDEFKCAENRYTSTQHKPPSASTVRLLRVRPAVARAMHLFA